MGQDESCQPPTAHQAGVYPPSDYFLPVSAQSGLVEAGPLMAGPGRSCPCCHPRGLLSHQGQGHFMAYKTHFLPQDPARGVNPSPKATPAQLPVTQSRSEAKTVLVERRTPRRGTSAPDLEGNNAITSCHMRMTKVFPALGAAHGMGR